MIEAIQLTQAQTLLLAMVVFFIGTFLHAKIDFIKNYNIPEPVVGGIFASLVLSGIHYLFRQDFSFDQEVYNDLMLTFFATVGLTAKFSFFRKGGRKIFIFLFVAGIFLVFQNLVGVFFSKLLGISPYTGLLTGSITLSGGHATGEAYSKLPVFSQVPQASAIAFACATFGMVLGGIIGGPISQLLIARHKLAPEDKVMNADDALRDHGFNEPETVTARSIIQVLLSTFLAIYLGSFIFDKLDPMLKANFGSNASIPKFMVVLMVGVVITNLCDMTQLYKVHDESTNLINTTSLTLFLSIAMMKLQLWEINLAEMAIPLIVIIFFQTILMAIYSYYITFRALGKDYDAAVIAGGHCGFGLGATSTAVANIESVTHRYGEAPRAMFTILMVGAFFIDVANGLVIQAFMYFL